MLCVRCRRETEIDELVRNTEKIQIVYNNPEGTYYDITDQKDIQKFAGYISSENTPVYHCGYDGKMIFFLRPDMVKENKNSIEMNFNLRDDCNHIEYEYAGELQTKKITAKGLDYLRSLNSTNVQ